MDSDTHEDGAEGTEDIWSLVGWITEVGRIQMGSDRQRSSSRSPNGQGINGQLGVDCFECPTLPGSVNFIEDFEQDRDSGSLRISGRMWRGVVLNNIQTCGGKPVYTRRRTCKS